MKKMLLLVLVLAMVFSFAAPAMTAESYDFAKGQAVGNGKYTYTVHLEPAGADFLSGETFNVDLVLTGDINYTQLAAEIAYDTNLLEYVGYTDLKGWAASVTKSAPDKVAVRSVPGMNMVVGEPCLGGVKIVTFVFKVKDEFVENSAKTILSFSSALVSPPGGVSGTTTAPGGSIEITINGYRSASVIVRKVWLDENGIELEEAPAIAEFSDGYVVGENKVAIGSQISFREYQTTDYLLTDITVNGEPVNAVSFTADDGVYEIVFTNTAIPEAFRPNDEPINLGKLFQLESDGYVEVRLQDDATIRSISGKFTTTTIHSIEDALQVFNQFAPLLGLDESGVSFSTNEITESSVKQDDFEQYFYGLSPIVNDVSVLGSEIILVVNKNRVACGVFSSYTSSINSVDTTPAISNDYAEETAINAVRDLLEDADIPAHAVRDFYEVDSRLIIENINSNAEPTLVWLVTVYNKVITVEEDEGREEESFDDENDLINLPLIDMSFYVSANGNDAGVIYTEHSNISYWDLGNITYESVGLTGRVPIEIQRELTILGNHKWRLRDVNNNIEIKEPTNTKNTKFSIIQYNGQLGSDSFSREAVSASYNVTKAFSFLRDLGYDSYGKDAKTTKAIINYNESYNRPRSQWSSSIDGGAMIFNKYEQTDFLANMAALEIVGHEYTHGVVAHKAGNGAGLSTNGESPFVNEALAYIMGMLTKADSENIELSPQSDLWILGFQTGKIAEIMSDLNYYAKTLDQYHTDNDRSTHHRSLLHAAYLMMVDNGENCDKNHDHSSRTKNINAREWGNVFYRAFNMLNYSANFHDFRDVLIKSTRGLEIPRVTGVYFNDDQVQAVKDAFDDVGIYEPYNPSNMNPNTGAGDNDWGDWKPFEHTKYTGRYSSTWGNGQPWPRPNSIIKTGAGKDIQMLGFQQEAYKDFLFKASDGKGAKAFSFNMLRDKTDWHSIEGGGFLFNTKVDEAANTIEGYCVLSTQTGLKLVRINRVNLTNFRNGSYNMVQNAGQLLATYNIGDPYAWRTFTIIATPTHVSVYAGNTLVIDNYRLPVESASYGYGPITSHISHACSQLSFYTFSNIQARDYSTTLNPNTGL